jgi:hypothetical protein
MAQPVQQQGDVVVQGHCRIARGEGAAEPLGRTVKGFATSLLTRLLAFPLRAGVDGAVGATFQMLDGGLEIMEQMEVIATARDLGESQLLAGAEATAAIADCRLGREPEGDLGVRPIFKLA